MRAFCGVYRYKSLEINKVLSSREVVNWNYAGNWRPKFQQIPHLGNLLEDYTLYIHKDLAHFAGTLDHCDEAKY